ncbi:ABC transporter substrate-binding protein [Deinococcus malanensis]|uniref:ABC transporter substrate-binding protein n=1 Tax=Deinococcus malanensis TaxID=1706855 RepID=UPI00363C8974
MRLTLRPGLRFADGSALTAQDVKWSLDRARKPDNGAWSGSLASISTIVASGNTVTLNLKQPDPTLPLPPSMPPSCRRSCSTPRVAPPRRPKPKPLPRNPSVPDPSC